MAKIGVIGLGKMGCSIARRMRLKGMDVSGWTRSGRTPKGINTFKRLETLVDKSDTLILSLFDDAAVMNILDMLLEFDLSGIQVIDTSTVSPQILIGRADQLSDKGAVFVDAPISGGPELVKNGTCGIFIGGEDFSAERAAGHLSTISQRIFHVGPLGTGMVMKTINNSMVQIYVSGLTELMPLAKKAGLPLKIVLDILCTGPAGLPVVRDRIPKILGDDDSVGFTNSGTAKDNDVFRKILNSFDMRSPMLEEFDRHRAFSKKMDLTERDPAELIRAAYEITEATW